ncbi:murein transglycosylase A [Poseidonocella sedimentorum]|uniref:peptidoglycan lytic exotransglycosylase n=1 Tax=Poseidonocella sedimentorum TaxID=871652 RepID=A0A1I6D6N1_9RHOB|nr:membrane-bound lytic murein transglycosylase A [Poseidonocella sedimentorum]
MRALRAAILSGAVVAGSATAQEPRVTLLGFEDLDGWAEDDHLAAFTTFRETCLDLTDPDWQAICAAATAEPDPRLFFETFFRPVLVEDGAEALFTGYFEPELDGALRPSDRFRYPLYRMPDAARQAQPWLTRAEIESSGAMAGQGLELVWVDDPVELFFLQVQGSGRVRLPDGGFLRVGYAGANGHPYRSIGKELARRGVFAAHQVSAQRIKAWVRDNPDAGQALLHHNPSYVFFREINQVPPDRGPLGAMNRSVTAMRTLAVDPAYTPLGVPVWLEKDGQEPLRRLMIAQDTGSAIKGAQRADVFVGTGDFAGRTAGRMRDPGRMILLLPNERAFALFPPDAEG